MKVLIIDSDGVGLDLALRAQDYLHEVKIFFRDDKNKPDPTGEGLVTKIKDWESSMDWADIIIPTSNVKYVHQLERYRKYGYPIFGPSLESSRLEIDREHGQKVLKAHGINTIPYQTFNSYNEAEAFVRQNPTRWVSKPLGDNSDKGLSYVAKNPADMVYMLQRWKDLGKNMGTLMLQEFKEGIEFGVSGWLGKNGWVGLFNENFEHKKLMNDELGPNTGEQGTVMKYVEKSKIAKEVLEPLTEHLISIGHIGDVDLNCMVTEDGEIWPLEFTCRPGYPSSWIQDSCHDGDPVEWRANALEGKDTLVCKTDHSTGVVISQPDYPYSHITQREVVGIPVYGIDEIRDDVHPVQMMSGKAPYMDGEEISEKTMLVTSGDYILIVTAQGQSVSGAKRSVYSKIKKLEIPNSIMYRTDIGSKLKEQIPLLQEVGLASEWSY